MRTLSLFTFFLLFGACCTAQELVGPDRTLPGTLASFEIVPEQAASWNIVTPSLDAGTYKVDTGLSTLYFASPERGRYTVIAGIVIDGKPTLLVKTFINGEEDTPTPLPPVTSLEVWIKTQLPVLVKSKHLASESRLVAECFEQIVRQIDDSNIKTPQNAQTQLQIALTGSLALTSPTAVTDWMSFLAELSQHIEKELGDQSADLAEMKKTFQKVANAMKFLQPPEGSPNIRTQGTPNRGFRTLMTK